MKIDRDSSDRYRQQAHLRYSPHGVRIDERAQVMLGMDGGAWVEGWVWIPEESSANRQQGRESGIGSTPSLGRTRG